MMAVVIVLLVLAAVYLYLIAPEKNRPDASHLEGWHYAHRGLHDGNRQVIENSMEAFRRAVNQGYGIELDVQLTRDGQLIVHHDGSLKRVCGVDGLIQNTDYAALPLLPDGSKIPLFSEVLDMVNGRVPLIVEVKHNGGPAKNAEAAWKVLQSYQGPYCVESFNPMAMQYFRQNAPGVVRGQLASGGKWKKEDLNLASYIALRSLIVNAISRPHFVAYSVPADRTVSMWLMKHVYKPLLACWTVRDPKTLAYAKKAGYQYPIFELFEPEK